MPETWSQRIEERFAVTLPTDVVDWFDGKLRTTQTAFVAFEPEQILEGDAGIVWGGQHLPDTLPLLDTGCGDVWCLRFGPSGKMTEVIFWQHEGGNWRPAGSSLVEALAYEINGEVAEYEDVSDLRDWVSRWLEVPSEALTSREALFDNGIAQLSILRDRCQAALSGGLHDAFLEVGGGTIAEAVGVEWPFFYFMSADTRRFQLALRERIASYLRVPSQNLFDQDWEAAARHAADFLRLRSDIAWPAAVLGYAAERFGDLESAVRHYEKAIDTLGSSQDFVEEWHPPNRHWPRKFAIQQLVALRPDYDSNYVRASQENGVGIEQYWLALGEKAEAEGRHAEAYRCYYNSGWDDFTTQNVELLERLTRSATAAGFEALGRIGAHHLASLKAL